MVCSLGSGRMEAMARLLAAGSFSQTIAEEVGNQKLAAQCIQRELREADEANLLDEEDMHVFDLKPMTDSLHLVRCNACKKPIKASQYAAHAELCKSLSPAEEIVAVLDGGTGHKKPPRKERKKLLTAYATTLGGEQGRFESAEANDVATLEFRLGEQNQLTSSLSMETKRNSSCVDGAFITDGSGVSPAGNTDYSTGAMPPPAKRSKLMASEGLPMPDHLETASGVTKSLCISTQEARTCGGFPKESSGGSKKTFDCVVGNQKPSQVHERCLLSKDAPAPLATKVFYSQRNHRLRSALTYLYYEASFVEHSGDLVNQKTLNAMQLQVSSPKNFSYEQINVQRGKREKSPLPSVQKPDQILADSSDAYLGKLGGCMPAANFSNHVSSVNNILRPQTASIGIARSNYHSKPYSFAGNTGMQQPKGSVPVI
ncbi:hypothetical protein ACSBR2_031260 [Camellia fascicularis]